MALALLAAAVAVAGCDRGVELAEEDARGVEAANAQMDELLLDGPAARRIARHALTVERVERWFAAQEALDELAADDPTLLGGPTEQAAGEDAIAAAVERLEERPAARDAIEEAGLGVEDFVLTGLAMHQALTASGPAAPPALRRLAARNARFVTSNADLLARFRTRPPAYVAAAPAPDSVGYYDVFGDSMIYDVGGDTAPPPPDTAMLDTTALLPDTMFLRRRDTLVPPPDTVRAFPPLPPPA